MNKGQTIRALIGVGLSNEAILLKVPTTINSIRWHRSKMLQGSTLSTSRAFKIKNSQSPAPRSGVTVGQALEKHGFANEVRACLVRLEVDQAETVYSKLAEWTFVLNGRVTSRFGQCSYTRRTIEVHEKLLALPEDFRITFLHECAHALDKLIHGISSSHGYAWKRIMSIGFQLPPIRCGHKTGEASAALNELKISRAIEMWACVSCGTELPIMKKRKYAPHQYSHKGCGGHFEVKI